MKLAAVVALLVKMYTSPALDWMNPLLVTVYVFWKTLIVGSVIHAPLLTTAPENVPTLWTMFNVPALVNVPLMMRLPVFAVTTPLTRLTRELFNVSTRLGSFARIWPLL